MGQEDQGLKAVISGSFFPCRLGWGGLELACIFSLLLCGHRMHKHKHPQGDRHIHRVCPSGTWAQAGTEPQTHMQKCTHVSVE